MINKNFYLPIFNFKQTSQYINEFNKKLFELFNKENELMICDLPIVCNIKSNLTNLNKSIRSIDFDNASNYEVYEFITDYDYLIRYFYYNINPNNNQWIFFKYNFINRDKKIDESNSVDTLIYNYEFKVKAENRNKEYIKELLNSIWMKLEAIIQSINLTADYQAKKIQFYNLKNKIYSFSYHKGFVEFVKSKKICGIYFDKKSFFKINNQKTLMGYDVEHTCSIYCWNEYMQTHLELVTITIRPDANIINNQAEWFNIDSELIQKDRLYEIIQEDKIAISCSIKIYFDNLIAFLLKKKSIKELPSKIDDLKIVDDYKNK